MGILSDSVAIRVGNDTATLRPTLAAGARLHARYGDYGALIRAVSDGNLTAIADVIAECSERYNGIPDVLRSLDKHPLQRGFDALSVPVLTLVLKLAGVDDDQHDAKPDTGERIPFEQYYERLFKIGCGALGWTPAVTWNATPAEIIAAYEGRVELIAAVFGGGKTDNPETQLHHTETDIAQGRASLRMLASSGQNRGV